MLQVLMPMAFAASSSSRIAAQARPTREICSRWTGMMDSTTKARKT